MYLVLNAGSSSVKFALFSEGLRERTRGIVDGIGLGRCELRIHGEVPARHRVQDHHAAIALIFRALQPRGMAASTLRGIGHRVVHGGTRLTRPTRITPAVFRAVRALIPLAPLHNPHNLAGIAACAKLVPHVPQVAVFDTGFHATLPEESYRYALPRALCRKHGIRKYGFHGISYQYLTRQTANALGRQPKRLVICHLGNGASLCAVKDGKSVETSMGFTPLDGLVMGTRAGQLDPGILLHLLAHGSSVRRLHHLLHHGAGLKALTGTSDMRDIHEGRGVTPAVRRRAFAVLTHRLTQYIGGYATLLGGLDALVFSAGIGENAWYLRATTCGRLKAWGIRLDPSRNRRNAQIVSASASKVKVLVLHTDEEAEIARQMRSLLA